MSHNVKFTPNVKKFITLGLEVPFDVLNQS